MAVTIEIPEFKGQFEQTKTDGGKVYLEYKNNLNEFLENLPVTKDQYISVKKYEAEYIKAATIASKNEAMKIFDNNKDVEAVEIKMPFGYKSNTNITTRVQRSAECKNVSTGETFMASKISVNVKDNPTSGNWLKTIKKELTEKYVGK